MAIDLNDHEIMDVGEGISCLGSALSDPFASANEFPLREVVISGFGISRYPTTYRQFYRFCFETGTLPPKGWGISPTADGLFPAELDGRENLPATFISWEMARSYCDWLTRLSGLNVTLPTEAEWEKAARGDDRVWPWGNTFEPERCNSVEAGLDDMVPVAALPGGASPYGCEQMSGGVWEWCLDFHHHQSHSDLPFVNPINLQPGPRRVVKGGSTFCTKEIVRPACRDWTNSVNQGGGDDGFRIAVRSHSVRLGISGG